MCTAPRLQIGEHLLDPSGALAAGRALAAGLMMVEVRDGPQCADHAGVLVHHHHARGAHQGAGRAHRIEIHVDLHRLFRGEHRKRRTAGNDALEFAVVDRFRRRRRRSGP